MAKYSTGSTGGGGGTTCELCGTESDSLTEETVAGARLSVCPGCATHGDGSKGSTSSSGSNDRDERNRKKKAAQNVAKATPVWDGDSEHWEREGTNYDDDPLPYLVSEYGDVLESARQDAGLTREELAEDLGVPESDLLAIEQGRATQAGIGGGLIDALEERLDVELAE
ncbi:helix-turn-helix domain-containing protein [Halovivax limisalsi]|uniref:helix-turn-helix domain-containing protein n=1 Tax=Halovivax limisalsi TaxID=1453760 RepID=UPI001FFD1B65|nr:multiprotein-bridging factor 1 family protein [Halovivax limisalsi]